MHNLSLVRLGLGLFLDVQKFGLRFTPLQCTVQTLCQRLDPPPPPAGIELQRLQGPDLTCLTDPDRDRDRGSGGRAGKAGQGSRWV